jgi:hypothetical protein
MNWWDLFYVWIRESVLRRYLLGRVGSSARSVVERGYFRSPRLYERLNLAEQDLVISYVQGHLSRADNASFEAHYLTSAARRERVELSRFVAETPLEVVPIATRTAGLTRARLILTAITAAIVMAIPVLFWESHRTQVIRVEWSSATRDRAQSGAMAPYRIGRMTVTVRFEVEPSDTSATAYFVTLSIAGSEISKATLKSSDQKHLDLDVPVSKLSTGVFDLKVEPQPPGGNPANPDHFRFEVRMP